MSKSKHKDVMLKCIRYISDLDVQRDVPIGSVFAAIGKKYVRDAESRGTVESTLQFLAMMGVLSLDEANGTMRVGGASAILALRSLRECLKTDVHLVTDWDRLGVHEHHLGVDEVITSGVDLVHWLETVRARQPKAIPIKKGHVSKAVIKGSTASGEPAYLMQRSPESGRYSLIGGVQRPSDGSPEMTMQRELHEELRGNTFRFGQNISLWLLGDVPAQFVSPKYGALTLWDCHYFAVETKGMTLQLPPDTCWVSHEELRASRVRTGEPILQLPPEAQAKLADFMEKAPVSVTYPIASPSAKPSGHRVQRDSWIERICAQCQAAGPGIPSPTDLLDSVVSRLHAFVLTLAPTKEKGPGIVVSSERDLQHVLHALLQAFFADVRPEEFTPSTAGAGSRMDFLLVEEKVVVEVKLTRPSMTHSVLLNELIVDISKYQKHPSCEVIYFVVYDPKCRLRNPQGLEKDLSKKEGKVAVRVRVVSGV